MIPTRIALMAVLPGLCLFGFASEPGAKALTPEQQKCVGKGKMLERAGWIYVHVEGDAHDRGFQHGYLLAKDIAAGLKATRTSWEHESGMDWDWLVNRASVLFVPKIDAENLAEIDGIAEGARTAGISTSRAELIAYNGILELQGYWWPTELKKIKDQPVPGAARQSCSSFIATGNWTK